MNQTIDYLATLSDAEMKAAIAAMPPEERSMLVQTLCHNVNLMARKIIDNKDEIWETGELPVPDFFNKTPKANQ